MTKTLFDSRLSGREFGSHLLYVPAVMEWAKGKGLQLRTKPLLDDFEFVQAESLLCAIELYAGSLSDDQVLEIVAKDPTIKDHLAADSAPAWLLGVESSRKWRALLTGAIEGRELSLLDFGSKLPIDAKQPAPEQDTATLAPVGTAGAPVDNEWIERARARAAEIIKRQRKLDLYPNQENIGDEIAKEFRTAGIVGADGKPLTGSTIKRHALKGISSATGKQLSTTIGQGK